MAKNMSEAEWAQFAAAKDLDAATGGKKPPITESAGMNDRDFRQIMAEFKKIHNAIERTQIFVVIGFAALALLHFIK